MIDHSLVKQRLIKKAVGFVPAKWTGDNTFRFQHLTCCHCKSTSALDELALNPNALHNTGFKKDVRKQMLNGERSGECDYCWRIEDNTDKFSDRVYKSAAPFSYDDFDTIKKFTGDEDFYPRYVEVSFGNVCNFKCSYCGP